MAGSKFTQKQIAEKYKGNFDYFKKGHYFRRLRGWCFLVAVVASVGGLVAFQFWGKQSFLTTGPISENHASFANDCTLCHLGADSNLLGSMLGRKSGSKADAIKKVSIAESPGGQSLIEKGKLSTSISLMDQACLNCHDAMGLHQPQSAGLALQKFGASLSVVHASQCAVCHREHVGHERMALPSSQTCSDCHNDAAALEHSRQLVKLDNPPLAATGETRDLGDGLLRFFPPASPALKPFSSYSEGHPPFGYEQANLRDPANLKFNHARHERDDMPMINQRKMTCTDCHKPATDGAYYQKVTYEQSCAQCHSLQIQPSLPKVLIPHGDPLKVRYFLASLKLSFSEALRAEGISDPVTLDRQTTTELENLQRRGLNSLADLEERVFFLGDPRREESARIMKGSARKFLTECAKCHTVKPGSEKTPPVIEPVNMPDRWVEHGPFTHVPHQHMDCADCHGAARESKLTSDILLPSQSLCAECHRPLQQNRVVPTGDSLKLQAELRPGSHELAASQRRTGGIRADCQTCHSFHAPAAATLLIEASAK